MSVILNPELACFSNLKNESPAQVVEALADGRSLKAFSSLKVGVVNLMPTKEATERQWSRLMLASKHWVEPVWIQMESHRSKNAEQAYLDKFYTEASTVDWKNIDGLVITGAPVELMAFESVDYWPELCDLIDFATEAHVPILAVCWGAQALLYKRYGIDKQSLTQKCFGVFKHQVDQTHPMAAYLPDTLYLPHSRHTGWSKQQIEMHPDIDVVIHSEQAGVFALEDTEGDWYWSGHPEYDTETLVLEYQRDLAKGLKQSAPEGYKLENGAWVPEQTWQAAAADLVGNWLDALAPRLQHAAFSIFAKK